jgi:hypothetical protein
MGSDDGAELIAAIKEGILESQRQSRPDPTIIVYCDKHLPVRMARARSQSLAESGEASADVNPLDFWRCPKPGCERCYEPTMFGYFCYGSEMGSRIERNSSKQPRGNHQGLPFMYIGKVGDGRRFVCPFYKCDEQGEDFALSVVDEEVAIPEDPLSGLGKEERKRTIEMAIFKSFASASGIGMDEGSAINHPPDAPDVRCTISGKPRWFELGQIINEEVAAKINPKRQASTPGFSFSQEDPFVEIITKKKSKTYQTAGDPVDLVLHFDLRLGSKSVVLGQIEKHADLLESLLADGSFSGVWIFDDWTKSIVWSKSRS